MSAPCLTSCYTYVYNFVSHYLFPSCFCLILKHFCALHCLRSYFLLSFFIFCHLSVFFLSFFSLSSLLTIFFQAFVENNPAIRWCPAARCERAVRLTRPGPGDSDPHSFPLLPSPAVDCGKGHLFCWYTLWVIAILTYHLAKPDIKHCVVFGKLC